MSQKSNKLEFRGGVKNALIPVVVFFGFSILFSIVFRAFEMPALAMGAIFGLLIGGLFTKKGEYDHYWSSVTNGAKESIGVVIILLVIGMFSQLISVSNISGSFAWLAYELNVGVNLFTALTFIFCAIIATATGGSLGTMTACFPIFFPAGVLLGGNPSALAGAIISGAAFGDNIAPISDTTVVSAGSQEYQNKKGVADIIGVVASRLKYALIGGVLTFFAFLFFSGGEQVSGEATGLLQGNMGPRGLVMLIPVAIMLFVAIKHGSLYLAITIALISGLIIGLIFQVITFSDIITVNEGVPAGLLVDGISGMMGISVLVIGIFGIMGVLSEAGVLDGAVNWISNSRLGKTVPGTEIAMMIGITVTEVLFSGLTSPAIATFGKVQNNLGKRAGLHPYRRANLLDGFAQTIALTVPFSSIFVLLGSQLTMGYEFVEQVSIFGVSQYMLYSYFLFIVLLVSIFTGWGRTYEGKNGEPVKESAYMNLGKVKGK